MNQRIYITTLDDAPTFDVSSKVSDKFIDEEIRCRFGKRTSGKPHDWRAYDLDAEGRIIDHVEESSLDG